MLVDQRIHVYLSLTDEVDRPEAQAACAAILSPAERERAQRLQSERQRREFILAHGLVRAVLSRRVPAIHPADWRFRIDRHGRPFISGPCSPGLLHFSISHTDGCVACAISPCAAIGVDVEATDRLSSPLAIAEHTFSTAEIETLQGLSATEQVSRFFDYWTLKEAYCKARGMGLLLPLQQFSMLIGSDGKIGIAFAPDFADNSARWSFVQTSPSPRHRLAVADGSGLPGRAIVIQSWLPCFQL